MDGSTHRGRGRLRRAAASLVVCAAAAATIVALPGGPARADTPPFTWRVAGDAYTSDVEVESGTMLRCGPDLSCTAPEPFATGPALGGDASTTANVSCFMTTCIGMLTVSTYGPGGNWTVPAFSITGVFIGRADSYSKGASVTLSGSILALGNVYPTTCRLLPKYFSLLVFQPITITLAADGSTRVVMAQNKILQPMEPPGKGCTGEVYTLNATWSTAAVAPGFSIG